MTHQAKYTAFFRVSDDHTDMVGKFKEAVNAKARYPARPRV